jgi:hypothetical protein
MHLGNTNYSFPLQRTGTIPSLGIKKFNIPLYYHNTSLVVNTVVMSMVPTPEDTSTKNSNDQVGAGQHAGRSSMIVFFFWPAAPW